MLLKRVVRSLFVGGGLFFRKLMRTADQWRDIYAFRARRERGGPRLERIWYLGGLPFGVVCCRLWTRQRGRNATFRGLCCCNDKISAPVILISRFGSAVFRLCPQRDSVHFAPRALRDQGLALESSFIGLERGMLGTRGRKNAAAKLCFCSKRFMSRASVCSG